MWPIQWPHRAACRGPREMACSLCPACLSVAWCDPRRSSSAGLGRSCRSSRSLIAGVNTAGMIKWIGSSPNKPHSWKKPSSSVTARLARPPVFSARATVNRGDTWCEESDIKIRLHSAHQQRNGTMEKEMEIWGRTL